METEHHPHQGIAFGARPSEDRPTLIHRIDDVGDLTPGLGFFLHMMADLHIMCVLAVIPDWLTPAMRSAMLAYDGVCIFQHGSGHTNRVAGGYPDEFPSSMPRSEVAELLLAGRRRLEDALGRSVAGYVPPWNTTSPQTISVLEELGYEVYSGHSRFPHHTTLRQVNVTLDFAASYEPLRLKSEADVLLELDSTHTRENRLGIMYHLGAMSVEEVTPAASFVRGVAPLSAVDESLIWPS